MLRRERWRHGDRKGPVQLLVVTVQYTYPLGCLWAWPMYELCLSLTVWTPLDKHTHTRSQVHTNRSACPANADRCADSVNKILPQCFHARLHTPTPPPTCTCLAATWEADLTDTSSRSLVAQVLPAAEAVKIFPCSPHNLLPSFFSDRVRSVSRLPVKPVCSLSQGLDFVTAKVRFPRTHPVLFWDTL